MQPLAVERRIWIDAPRERVWHAVTDAKQLEQWWPSNYWDIPTLAVGARVRFGPDDAISYATIDVLDPPRQFTLHWASNERFPTDAMTTTLLLEDENGGTRVTVTQAGYETLPDDTRQHLIDITGQGYTQVLGQLKALIER